MGPAGSCTPVYHRWLCFPAGFLYDRKYGAQMYCDEIEMCRKKGSFYGKKKVVDTENR